VSEANSGWDAAFGGVSDAIGSVSAKTAAAAAAAAAGDGIVVVDDDGTIRYGNAAAAELLALPVAQMAGQMFGFPLMAGEPTEIDVVRPSGEAVTVEIRVTETTWQNTRLHIATLRDVTRRQRTERDLKAALERQNIVVGVAAHELQSPLFGIRVLVETLRDRGHAFTQAQRDEVIGRVCDRVDALQSLLRKLLTAARIDTGPRAEGGAPSVPVAVPVLEVLLECLAEFGGNARQVHLSCPAGLVVTVHRGEFGEMIGNYLDNAFTHGRPPVEVHVTGHAGRVELRVCDSGPGVPEPFVPRMFQRFSRLADRSGARGSGLGLWIVARLAAGNGGHAWYEPRPGGGSCFCLDLPQAPPARAR
jgi:signal transduction histidine kinase